MKQEGHIVKSYDEEIKDIKNSIVDMGSLVEKQLKDSLQCLKNKDTEFAEKIIENDNVIDKAYNALDQSLIEILGKRQPMASDLRTIFSAIKINKDLERIGDHATKIAEIVLPEKPSRDIINMGEKVNIMISEVIKAFLEFSDEDAKKVWLMDREIDEEYLGILRQLLTYMMEEPKRITACTSLLYMVKNLERMGDYVQNIAEDIYYAVSGEPLFDGSSDPTWEAILPKKK